MFRFWSINIQGVLFNTSRPVVVQTCTLSRHRKFLYLPWTEGIWHNKAETANVRSVHTLANDADDHWVPQWTDTSIEELKASFQCENICEIYTAIKRRQEYYINEKLDFPSTLGVAMQ